VATATLRLTESAWQGAQLVHTLDYKARGCGWPHD
jgi:hypothetical protein